MDAYLTELEMGKRFMRTSELDLAYRRFERAHILGQLNPIRHTESHFWLLRVAIRKRDYFDIFGQIFRILTGFLGSIIGVVPTGNTGGSNVNPFKKMDIPNDLKEILDK